MSTIIRFDNILWSHMKVNPDAYPKSVSHECTAITDESIEEELFKEHLETLYGGKIDIYDCRFIGSPLEDLDDHELTVLGCITSAYDDYTALDLLTEWDREVADELIQLGPKCVPALQDLMYIRDEALEIAVCGFQEDFNDLESIREFIADLN